MAHKTGRNEPCPCGSGKKYKHCCLIGAPLGSQDWVSQNWQYTSDDVCYKLRKTERALHDRLTKFVLAHIPTLTLKTAMDNFVFPETGLALDEQAQRLIYHAFESWFFYNWPLGQEDPKTQHKTIATWYAAEQLLSPYEKSLLEAISKRPYSLFQVIDTQPGCLLYLKDIFTLEILTIHDIAASKTALPGSIFLAKPVSCDNRVILVGTLPFCLPPFTLDTILSFRESMENEMGKPLTQSTLARREGKIFDLYKSGFEQIKHTPSPSGQKEQETFTHKYIELLREPDIQAQLGQAYEKICETWISTELPSLNGMTPLVAARDPLGREHLEPLLLELEYINAKLKPGVPQINVSKLREMLGMLKETVVKH